MADPNITEEVHFEMLEKKSDGTFKAKYPRVKSKSGVTFDEHLADDIHVPSGIIAMWSGTHSAIPSGWHLCNGQNGTPDLRDRFILGAMTESGIGETGGQHEVTLTVDQMPSHSHSGKTNSTGSHTHELKLASGGDLSGGGLDTYVDFNPQYYTDLTRSAGSHSHTLTINSTGEGQAHENRPAYYALAFIMKV